MPTDDDILKLLHHPDPRERAMALKLAGVTPEHLKHALDMDDNNGLENFDLKGGLHSQVLAHPAVNEDVLNHYLTSNNTNPEPFKQALRHPTLTSKTLENVVNEIPQLPLTRRAMLAEHPLLPKSGYEKLWQFTDHAKALSENPNAPADWLSERALEALREKHLYANGHDEKPIANILKHPNLPGPVAEQVLNSIKEYPRVAGNAAMNPNLSPEAIQNFLNQAQTINPHSKNEGDLAHAGASALLASHPNLNEQHIDTLLSHSDPEVRRRVFDPLWKYKASNEESWRDLPAHPAVQPRHVEQVLSQYADRQRDNPQLKQDSTVLEAALKSHAARPEHIQKILEDEAFRDKDRDLALQSPEVTREHISYALKHRPKNNFYSMRSPQFDAGHINEMLSNRALSEGTYKDLEHHRLFNDSHLVKAAYHPNFVVAKKALMNPRTPPEGLERLIFDPQGMEHWYQTHNFTPAQLQRIAAKGGKSFQYAASNKNADPGLVEQLSQQPDSISKVMAAQSPNATPEQLQRALDIPKTDPNYNVARFSALEAVASHKNATPEQLTQVYNEPDLVTKVKDEALKNPHTPPELLHHAAINDQNNHYLAIQHPNVSPETLEHIANSGSYYADKARDALALHNPDAIHKEKVDVKFDTNRLRKIRDFIRSHNVDEMRPKDLPQGDWKAGRLPNGNISAKKLDEHIASLPTTRYNVGHTEWTGAQRHNEQPSKVFQLNLTNEHIKKLKDAGLYNTFRKLHDVSYQSGHPVNPSTVGWVRYTQDPKSGEMVSRKELANDNDAVMEDLERHHHKLRENQDIYNELRSDDNDIVDDYDPDAYRQDMREGRDFRDLLEDESTTNEQLRDHPHVRTVRNLIDPSAYSNLDVVPKKLPGKSGIQIDEVQSDIGQSFVQRAAAEAREKATEEAAKQGMSPEATQAHVEQSMKQAHEEANKEWPEEQQAQISKIVFAGKHPSELLQEAFLQHLRNTNQHDTPVHIHAPKTKAPISGMDMSKPLPGHMKMGYEQVPKKMGFEPAKYGELKTQTNPELKGEEQYAGTARKFEEDLSAFLAPLRKSEKSDHHTGDLDPNSEIVKDMLGYSPEHHASFKAAAFLSQGFKPHPDAIKDALVEHDQDHEAAALKAHGLEPNETNRKALKAISQLAQLSKSAAEGKDTPQPQSIEPGAAEAVGTVEKIARAFHDKYVVPIELGGKHSQGSLLARDPQTDEVWLLKPNANGQSPAYGLEQDPSPPSAREAAFYQIAKLWHLEENLTQTELVYLDDVPYAAMRLLSWDYKPIQKLQKEHPTEPQKIMRPYLNNGKLFQWAILDLVLGNADRHGGNILVSPEGKVILLDHGSSFASDEFSPGYDKNVFIPYYLRAWATDKNFHTLPVDRKMGYLPRVSGEVEATLRAWLDGLDPYQLESVLDRYGIDPAATVERLHYLKELVMSRPVDWVVDALWSGAKIE